MGGGVNLAPLRTIPCQGGVNLAPLRTIPCQKGGSVNSAPFHHGIARALPPNSQSLTTPDHHPHLFRQCLPEETIHSFCWDIMEGLMYALPISLVRTPISPGVRTPTSPHSPLQPLLPISLHTYEPNQPTTFFFGGGGVSLW